MKVATAIVLALAFAGVARAAGPVVKHTAAGTTAAKATLLKLSDLGTGWTAKSAGSSSPTFSCKGYAPKLAGIVETGSATSPDFSGGSTGPFVVQETGVYASAAQASALWARAVKPGLATCDEETLETITAKGIRVKIDSVGTQPIAKVTPHTTEFRVVGTLTSKTQTLKTYFDTIVVSKGSVIVELTLSSFVQPVPAVVEKALATLIANRIGQPVA